MNEWNVNFLKNTIEVQKVTKLKIYSPRHKWRMNEGLIFFMIWAVLKKYWDWSWIYKDRKEQWMKLSFSLEYSFWYLECLFQWFFHRSKHH